METLQDVNRLTEEVNLLLSLSKDLSFDMSVINDAKLIAEDKNKIIVDLGGNPVIVEPEKEVGISKEQLLESLRAKLNTFSRYKDKNEKFRRQYNLYDKLFKMKSGISYDEYLNKGGKFLYGGILSSYTNNILSNLERTNQFFFVRETDKDPVLRYTTPDNSVLYQVLLPKSNSIAYGLAYNVNKNTIVDFYMDEDLTKSLNATYSFSATLDYETFNNEYTEMMKMLSDIDDKYYS